MRGIAGVMVAVLAWQVYARATLVARMLDEIGTIWTSSEEVDRGTWVTMVSLDLPVLLQILGGAVALVIFTKSVNRADDRTALEAVGAGILALLGLGMSLMVFYDVLD